KIFNCHLGTKDADLHPADFYIEASLIPDPVLSNLFRDGIKQQNAGNHQDDEENEEAKSPSKQKLHDLLLPDFFSTNNPICNLSMMVVRAEYPLVERRDIHPGPPKPQPHNDPKVLA